MASRRPKKPIDYLSTKFQIFNHPTTNHFVQTERPKTQMSPPKIKFSENPPPKINENAYYSFPLSKFFPQESYFPTIATLCSSKWRRKHQKIQASHCCKWGGRERVTRWGWGVTVAKEKLLRTKAR